METFDKEYFQKLAGGIMLDVNDEEVEDLKQEFAILTSQIQLFDKVDTEGVEPMIYPFEEETHFLREDVVYHVLSQQDALKNAKSVRAGHVHVPKVVK